MSTTVNLILIGTALLAMGAWVVGSPPRDIGDKVTCATTYILPYDTNQPVCLRMNESVVGVPAPGIITCARTRTACFLNSEK